jgi:MtrB/PioB family decaheme-associated outer membrane protein
MQHKQIAQRLALALLLLQSGASAFGETTGSVATQGGYLDSNAWRFGNFSGVNTRGFVPFLDFSLQNLPAPASGDIAYWRIEGQRIGLETGRLALDAGEQGKQRIRLDYRRLSTYQFDDARTPVLGAGNAALTLPSNWQATAPTTAGMTTLQENLVDLNLWQRRHSLRLDYQRALHPAWTLLAEIRQERIDGTRLLGAVTGATGGNSRAALLPGPVDYATSIATLNLAYASQALHWRMGYQGSVFTNGARALTWPALYGQHPQWNMGTGFPDGRNQLALEPDNEAHQLSSGGSLVLSPSQRLQLDAALGRQRQNAGFLPYTVNSVLLPAVALPRESLQGRVDTTRLEVRLHSRVASRLNLVSRLAYRGRDNRTAVTAFQRVRGDAVQQQPFADARLNRPYGLAEARAAIDANYRLTSRMRFEAGVERLHTERTFSETLHMRESSANIGLRGNLSQTVALAGEYRYQRRRTDDYNGNRPFIATHVPGRIGADEFENHPLLRKYYLSERDREQGRVHASWQAMPDLSIGAALASSRDDYPAGFLGLEYSILRSTTVDFSYAAAEHLRINGFYNTDRYRNAQAGRSFRGNVPADAANPDRNWQVTSTDLFNTWGLGLGREQLRLRVGSWQAPGLLALNLDFSHSRSSGNFDNSTGAALLSAPLPALGTSLDNFSLSARYAWSARASIQLALMHEHYHSKDFALDGVRPDTVASVLLPGMASPRYRVNWASLGYRFEF